MKKIGLILIMIVSIFITGCSKTESEKMAEKYKDYTEVTLYKDTTTAKIYLSDKILINTNTAIMGVTENQEVVNGKTFDISKKHRLSQIGITLKDNTTVQYQLVDGEYTKDSFKNIGKVKTLTIDEKKYVYVKVNNDKKEIVYLSIPGRKDNSILLVIESFHKITGKQLKQYAEKAIIVTTEK